MDKKKSTILIGILIVCVIIVAGVLLRSQKTEDEQAQKEVTTASGESYTSITPETYQAWQEDNDVIFIDVHIPEQNHIADGDVFIAYDQILESEQLPRDMTQKIVLYCRSGSMSKIAAAALAQAGYTNVYELTGGKNAYDAFLATQAANQVQKATGFSGFIDFDAELLTATYLPMLRDEFGDAFDALTIDETQTNVLLYANNHRIDLGDIDFLGSSSLNGRAATDWQPLSTAVGGHHIAGILTFPPGDEDTTLRITGLPTEEDALLLFY